MGDSKVNAFEVAKDSHEIVEAKGSLACCGEDESGARSCRMAVLDTGHNRCWIIWSH